MLQRRPGQHKKSALPVTRNNFQPEPSRRSYGRSSSFDQYRQWMIQYRFIIATAFLSFCGFYYFVPRIFSRKARTPPSRTNDRFMFEEKKGDTVPAKSASSEKAIQELNRLLQDAQSKNREMEEELQTTKHKMKELSTMKQKEVKSDTATTDTEKEKKHKEEMNEILTRERKKELKLMGEIQMMCRREVEEKFGPGPHRVEVTLDFPPEPGEDDEEDEEPTKFIIEMAPLDYMPHSVYLFLQQVSRNLWDGCSFHRNARHVIQAGTVPYHHSNKTSKPLPNKHGAFRTNFLLSVSFQEYHPKFPHKQFTVGFAGRPGGPDWYISTIDNTKSHGPGGQSNYEDRSEADPCFGRIVEGLDAVERLHAMPIKPGKYNALLNNVGIKSARIVKNNF